ncbi:MAG: phospholipid carrier-dependent glycosyltransferase [Phycisphaerales bacterium]|nr:phospholipid carrier-dependent glycosyltransferase [Phycisphaerales bacterium]
MTRLALAALAVFLLTSVLVLGARPLIAHDEARYAAIPAEMIASGDWTQLRLSGFRYYEKPPLGYWLTAASMSMLGPSAFAIRLPCAIAGGIAALAAWWVAVRITGRCRDGPLAFLVQVTTIGPAVLATLALLDPPFAACIAVTLAAFWSACTSRGRACAGWLLLAGVAAGAGFLIKGLLALAIPGAAAAGFLLWERRWRDLLLMPWIPLCSAVAAVAPVAWLMHQSEPDFWRYFIEVEHIRRFTNPDANQHPQPWWLYLAIFPVGAFMWTLAWPRAISGLMTDPHIRSGVRFCLCWIAVPMAALSMSSGKLPTYILPLYVPASVLVAIGLRIAFEQGAVRRQDADAAGPVALCVIGCLALALAATGPEAIGLESPWRGGSRLPLLIIAAASGLWFAIDRWGWRARDADAWVSRQALAVTPMLCALAFLFPDAIAPRTKVPWEVLAGHRDAMGSASLLLASAETAHAVTWTTGRRDFAILGRPSEFDNELGLVTEAQRLLPWSRTHSTVRSALAIPGTSVMLVADPWMAEALKSDSTLPAPHIDELHGNIAVMEWTAPVHSADAPDGMPLAAQAHPN